MSIVTDVPLSCRVRVSRCTADSLLNFLKRPHFNLPNALTADAEFGRQIFKRRGIFRQSTSLKNAPLALIQCVESCQQKRFTPAGFLTLDETLFLVRRLIDKPILPFTGLHVRAHRCIQRCITAQAPVHRNDFVFRDPKLLGNRFDVFRLQIAFFQSLQLALGAPQVEEQLLLRRRGAPSSRGSTNARIYS